MLARSLMLVAALQMVAFVACAEEHFSKTANGVTFWNPTPTEKEILIWIGGADESRKAQALRGMLLRMVDHKILAAQVGTFQAGTPRMRMLIVAHDGTWGQVDTNNKVTVQLNKPDGESDASTLKKHLSHAQLITVRDMLKSATASLQKRIDALEDTKDAFRSIEAGQLKLLWIHADYHRMLCDGVLVQSQ